MSWQFVWSGVSVGLLQPFCLSQEPLVTSAWLLTPVSSPSCFGTNLRECENIQNRDVLPSGPSFINSWPNPLPHFPHETFRAPSLSSSGTFFRELVWMGRVKAGQGVPCSYLAWLEKSWLLHSTQTYTPGSKWSLYTSSLTHEQNAMALSPRLSSLGTKNTSALAVGGERKQ